MLLSSSPTAMRAKTLKERRDKQIADMWLACQTQAEIAKAVGLHPKDKLLSSEICSKSDIWRKNYIFSAYQDPDWKPPPGPPGGVGGALSESSGTG